MVWGHADFVDDTQRCAVLTTLCESSAQTTCHVNPIDSMTSSSVYPRQYDVIIIDVPVTTRCHHDQCTPENVTLSWSVYSATRLVMYPLHFRWIMDWRFPKQNKKYTISKQGIRHNKVCIVIAFILEKKCLKYKTNKRKQKLTHTNKPTNWLKNGLNFG
jgi:hypothetical protein